MWVDEELHLPLQDLSIPRFVTSSLQQLRLLTYPFPALLLMVVRQLVCCVSCIQITAGAVNLNNRSNRLLQCCMFCRHPGEKGVTSLRHFRFFQMFCVFFFLMMQCFMSIFHAVVVCPYVLLPQVCVVSTLSYLELTSSEFSLQKMWTILKKFQLKGSPAKPGKLRTQN